MTNIRTFVDPGNPTRVGVLMDVADMDAVMAAMETEAATDAMVYDGVLPETLVMLVEAQPEAPSSCRRQLVRSARRSAVDMSACSRGHPAARPGQRREEREHDVAVEVIVELKAAPGRRDELEALLDRMVANHGPSRRGFLGSRRYELLDDPDTLIGIADWESAEARPAHMKESAITGAYAPPLDLLAAPFRATVIRQLL